jgi:hypothetical protein
MNRTEKLVMLAVLLLVTMYCPWQATLGALLVAAGYATVTHEQK